jgi:hypothetical protein
MRTATALRIRSGMPLAVLLFSLGLVGCRNSDGGGFPGPLSISISVNPVSATVPAGSSTTFIAVFAPTAPQGGTLTWSVTPGNGGTITNAGVYIAPGTAGNYVVTATWTPSSAGVGSPISGSATVTVAPPAQLTGALNTDLVQASGGAQGLGGIQNAAVVGQPVPRVSSTDANNNVQVRSGFAIPVCTQAGVCQ